MILLRSELNLMLIALTFLTRLPSPMAIDFNQNYLNQASRYFPLIGFLIGGLCALTYWLSALVFPQMVSVLITMLVSLLITGCFHEDGLADTADGLGGGFERHKKLAIMKDSRLGTYGAAALWMALTFKFILLIEQPNIMLALLIAHPVSRCVSTLMIAQLPYVSDDATAKAKPLAESQSFVDLFVAGATGVLGLLLADQLFFELLIALTVLFLAAKIFLKRQLGGFTGDTLGAIQQVAELLVYAILLVGVSQQ